MSNHQTAWPESGAHSVTSGGSPDQLLVDHVTPLLYGCTGAHTKPDATDSFHSEEQFWGRDGSVMFSTVTLNQYRIVDWFPRTPGVYWARSAQRARASIWVEPTDSDPDLGEYWSPNSKMCLIERGGIGTIRLLPRRIDDEGCWFATALTGRECHSGIPLALPNTLLRREGIAWGDVVNIRGRVRLLQEVGLDVVASRVHHARPPIVFVDDLKATLTRASNAPTVLTPVALFKTDDPEDYSRRPNRGTAYAFVQCEAGKDSDLDAAGDWIEKYAAKHSGRVVTNFDEQRPMLADAPLSYQRLVAKT